MSLTLYGTIKSRALRPLWLLEELGAEFTYVPSPPRDPAVVALNGSGKIPVLDVDGTIITDSTAILTYLSDRENRFTAPAGTRERARQDSVTFALLDEVETPLWMAAKHTFTLPEDLRHPAIKDSLKWEFAHAIDQLMKRKGEAPYLMGDDFTLPDIIAVHCGRWAQSAKFPVENAAFQDYLAKTAARPALARAIAR